MRRATFIAAGLVALAGCGWIGGDDGGDSGGETSLPSMLAWVPDTPANRGHPIYYADLERLRDGDSADSADGDLTLLLDRSSGAVFMATEVRGGITDPAFSELAGFDSRAIDAVLEMGVLPDQVAVLVGDFDAATIEAALRSSPGGDELAVSTEGEFTTYTLGAEGTDLEAVSPIRRVGQPVVITLGPGSLVWSRSAANNEPAVAATTGGTTSLAADPQYSSVATALDAEGIVNGVLVTAEEGMGWEVGGLGESFGDEDGSTLSVVLAYPTETDAQQAVDAFRAHIERDKSNATGQQWADVLTIDEITSEGRLLIATLSSTDTGIAVNVVLRDDNLLRF